LGWIGARSIQGLALIPYQKYGGNDNPFAFMLCVYIGREKPSAWHTRLAYTLVYYTVRIRVLHLTYIDH
jgi:hypothetical protein